MAGEWTIYAGSKNAQVGRARSKPARRGESAPTGINDAGYSS